MGRKAGFAFVILVPLATACLSGLGCTAPRPAPNIGDSDPEVKIAGIKQAEARADRASLPALVEQLNSDDPAVRLFAIHALEKFAGDRFGYEYYLDEDERKPSLERWREWLKAQK